MELAYELNKNFSSKHFLGFTKSFNNFYFENKYIFYNHNEKKLYLTFNYERNNEVRYFNFGNEQYKITFNISFIENNKRTSTIYFIENCLLKKMEFTANTSKIM